MKRPPLGQAVLAVACLSALALRVVQFGQDFHDLGPRWTDFGVYWADAVVARQQGLQAAFSQGACAHLLGGNECRLVEPPITLAPVLPLSFVPLSIAYLLWSALLVLLMVIVWWVLRPAGSRLAAATWLAALLAWFPVAYGIALGNTAVLVVGAIGIGGALLAADRPRAAGLVLGLSVLKPQLAVLVLPALAVGGWWRAALTAALVWVAGAAVSLALLGAPGVHALLVNLRWDASLRVNADFAFTAGLPAGVAIGIRAAVVAVTLAVARRARDDRNAVLAAGVLGSLLFTPYLHAQDLAVLVPVAWLWLSGRRVPYWLWGLMAAGYAAGDLLVVGRLPVFAVMAIWIGVLCARPIIAGPP